jgi:NADH dehydrogenase
MTSRLEQGSVATVLGGSGFLGRHAVRALAADGWRIRAATRRPDLAGFLQPMGAVGQVFPVQANLRYPDSVARAVEGATAVVNLVGILSECRFCLSRAARQSFHAVHVAGARAAAIAAREAGARTFVHVSAIGADRRFWAKYARTKAAGEAAVLAEFPGAVILRPSVVFGPEDQLFNRFAAMARSAPFLPLIGGGRTRFQPVYVGDVAAAVAAACAGKARPGTVYELGGPDVVSFRQLLDLVQEWSGHRRPYLRVPFWMAQVGAFFSAVLPQGLRPITVDQVRMLMRSSVVDAAAVKEGRTLEGLGIASPHTMASIVPQYLERFQPHGQFAHYHS